MLVEQELVMKRLSDIVEMKFFCHTKIDVLRWFRIW